MMNTVSETRKESYANKNTGPSCHLQWSLELSPGREERRKKSASFIGCCGCFIWLQRLQIEFVDSRNVLEVQWQQLVAFSRLTHLPSQLRQFNYS